MQSKLARIESCYTFFNRRKYFILFVFYLCSLLLNNSICKANIYYVTNDSTTGGVEFINAINQANTHFSKDSIYFNIPGGGPFNLIISTSIPDITDDLLIDGFSQSGNDTSNWLIRIFFPYTLNIKWNCEIRGMRFIAQASISHTTIQIKNRNSGNTYFPYDSVVICKNFFEQHNLVEREYLTSIPSGSAFIRLVRIEENKTEGSGFSIWMNHYTNLGIDTLYVRNNFFNPGGISVDGQDSSDIQAVYIMNNQFNNCAFRVEGTHHHVFIENNNVIYNNPINVYLATDSAMISGNDFSGGCYLNMDNQSTGERSWIFVHNNTFHDNNLFGINMSTYDGVISPDYLHQLSIRNNNFINNPGIYILANGLTHCFICNNTFTCDTSSHFASLIIIDKFGNQSNLLDSIVIGHNYMDGGGIEFSHFGLQSSTTVRKIHFLNNTILNCVISPAIDYEFSQGTIFDLYIDSNQISNSYLGIQIYENQNNFSCKIQRASIQNNEIENCATDGIFIVNAGYADGNTNLLDFKIKNNAITNNFGNGIELITKYTGNPYHSSIKNFVISTNTISGNSWNGISFTDYGTDVSGFENSVIENLNYSQNSIHSNGLKGIEIINDGDPDQLVSPIFYYPTLTSAIDSVDSLFISGTLNAEANTPYRIEFFRNSEKDSSGWGEGETYLSSFDIQTDANGFSSFTFPVSYIHDSSFFSSTATNLNTNNTSVFSNNISLTDIDTSVTPIPILYLFPNPVNSFCSINLSSFGIVKNWSAYSIDGKLINIPHQSDLNNLTLNFSDFPAGAYLLVLYRENNTTVTVKIIKQ